MIQANRNVASFNTIIKILQNDQSKIKLIMKYENTRKKIINNECAILFNKTCINEHLLPKYIHIYIYLYIYKKLSHKWKNFHEQKVFLFRFDILCENFGKIGLIIKKIP